ncbi:hypothetical protein V8E55_010337 [Tylopilus felleus]
MDMSGKHHSACKPLSTYAAWATDINDVLNMEIPLQVKHIHKDKGKQKAISEDKDDLQIQDMVMIKEEMEDVTMAETEARLSSTSEHESLQGMSMNLGEEDITGFLLTPESSTPKQYNVTKAPIILVPDSEEENDNAILPWMSSLMHLTEEIQTAETIKKCSLDMVDPSNAAGLDKGRPIQHTQFQPTQGNQLKSQVKMYSWTTLKHHICNPQVQRAELDNLAAEQVKEVIQGASKAPSLLKMRRMIAFFQPVDRLSTLQTHWQHTGQDI